VPVGRRQSHAAKLIEHAGYKIEFNCDLVIFHDDVTARLVAVGDVPMKCRRTYLDTLEALGRTSIF